MIISPKFVPRGPVDSKWAFLLNRRRANTCDIVYKSYDVKLRY